MVGKSRLAVRPLPNAMFRRSAKHCVIKFPMEMIGSESNGLGKGA
jgi:hypothetical protein